MVIVNNNSVDEKSAIELEIIKKIIRKKTAN